MFRNRKEAGELLAQKLAEYKGQEAVVYALPRGGVVLGYEIARALGVSLDLVIARKIGHPRNPEYAICAVTERGEPFCNETEKKLLDPAWLERKIEQERKEAKRRREAYLGGRSLISAAGKIAIVVDDGVATGLTLRAALKLLQSEKPKELVVAIPVAPSEMAEILRNECDKVVLLQDEEYYRGAVGSYYQDFSQTTDQEVIELLKK